MVQFYRQFKIGKGDDTLKVGSIGVIDPCRHLL